MVERRSSLSFVRRDCLFFLEVKTMKTMCQLPYLVISKLVGDQKEKANKTNKLRVRESHVFVMIVAILLLCTTAFSQGQWTRQSPIPAARNLTGVTWATATHGFASGEHGTFIETFDGGGTWQNANLPITPTTEPFYNTYCRDADNCFVIGNAGTTSPDHWRTTNGGASWQQFTNFPAGGSWRLMDFVSASVGFMGANGATARTTDGGTTWAAMSGYPSCPVIYGMDFRDELVGLAGGNRVSTTDGGPGIFKTTDAGVTWARKFSDSANDVLWLNNTTAIAIVGVSIYRSADAGETWSVISSQISTGFGNMTLLPGGTIVGVSLGGDAWRSTDGGFNWTRTLVGLGALPAIWNVSFFNDQIGAIVGQGGFIFKTTDGGLTWAMLNNGIGGVSFYDVEMFDDNAGLAVGDNGYLLRTSNGGARWETSRLQVTGVVVGRNESLQAISVVDANFAVAAGYDGVVYKTFDRGLTWQSIGYPNLPDVYFISDVKFITRDFGYVIGNRVNIAQGMFVTIDGGASWTLANINGGHSMDFVDANHGWVMSVGGLGYRTLDGGTTWAEMIMPNQGFSPSIAKIDFINENEGWAVGRYGYAAHTIDGGRSWQLQNIATINDVILGLHVLSITEVFAVGSSSPGGTATLYHTNNAGATWTTSSLPGQYSVSSIFATQSRKVWTAGYDGAVFHDPNFTVPSPAVLLTLNPTYIVGGNPVQGTVRLAGPAPTGGTTITLSNGAPSLIGIPPSVVVPAGATSATFNVTTQAVNQNPGRATVTAAYSGHSSQADLVLAPATDCIFSISPSGSEYFGANGGFVDIHVSAPAGCAWTASTDHTFVTLPNGNSGVGNGQVTVRVSAEQVGLARFATAIIAGNNYGIVQAPQGGCTYALASSGQSIGSAGGNGQVAVSAASCTEPWVVHNSANWITASPLSGQGNGVVNFVVAANNTGAPRAGTFTVSGRGFTVTQTASATAPPSITGTVTYGNAVGSPNPRFISNVLLSASGSPSMSIMTDFPGGTYSLSGFGAGAYTITPSKTGGVNGISSFDAARIAQHASGANPLTGNQLLVADVSGNGTVSSFDAGQIARYAVSGSGLGSGSTGNWIFSPATRSYPSVTSSITDQNYSALLMGEVSGNWTNSGARPSKSGGPKRGMTVNLPRFVSPTNTEIIIPVGIRGIVNKGIISYEFDLRYDPSVIRPQADPVDLAGSVSRGLTAITNAEEPGLLRIVVYGPMPIDHNGLLLNLRFSAVGASGSASPLTFERVIFNEDNSETTVTDGQVKLSEVTTDQTQISGRLLTSPGRGVAKAHVTLSDTTGRTRSTVSNGFGYYRFGNLQLGQTYTINIRSRSFVFTPRTVSVTDEPLTLDLITVQ
jgi:photosystem II stability/assembly factor-like uncharacterized protein